MSSADRVHRIWRDDARVGREATFGQRKTELVDEALKVGCAPHEPMREARRHDHGKRAKRDRTRGTGVRAPKRGARSDVIEEA